MDLLLASPQFNSAFSLLGSFEGDGYVVSPNALAILEEINYKLTYEDQALRTFRRAIGFGQNVRSNLIPLLRNCRDENVLDAVIRILVNLTMPIECLFSVDVMYRTEAGRQTIYELNILLYTSKEAFTDSKSTRSVIEYIKHILESDFKLSPKKCDQINNCLLLLRNILHIPDSNANYLIPSTSHHKPSGSQPTSIQNAILWNIFIQSIDKLLIHLMTCPERAFWGVTIVQFIALIYKDQHGSTLQKLLNLWFEASLSESSDDNESNTSPPIQGSYDSSPMSISDSDSSDIGKFCEDNNGLPRLMSARSFWHTRKQAFLNPNHSVTGGAGNKNGNSGNRLQALHAKIECTLQEVSRKGQEYQDSMLRVLGANNLGVTDSIEVISVCQEEQKTSQSMETVDDEGAVNSHGTIIGPSSGVESEAFEEKIITKTSDLIISTTPSNENEQPAKQNSSTSNLPEAAHFMPPPARPLKSFAPMRKKISFAADLSNNTLNTYQKSCHSGHIKLTMGVCDPQKRECPSSQSENSDCGYGTLVENQEFISTSSNDDECLQSKPQHKKPPRSSKARNKHRVVLPGIDLKELRRKKLVKRSKSSLINMKGLVQHTPTDGDISNLLKEFTVDFLLKGYGYLVDELHTLLLINLKVPMDTSHFFWLITYFLKFATQLELDMDHINTVLTFDVISYLTYEGVMLCQQLELNSRQKGSDLKPYLHSMHLVVTAIREFLQAIETYKKVTHLSNEDHEYLRVLQLQISSTEDLRNLFVLLLRRFNPILHTKQYLQDLVVTNHILLLMLDSVTKSNNNINIRMTEHISQFATVEIMHYFGMLLADFSNNGEFVNDCIFTMIHHIAGDVRQIGTLFQPMILKTCSRIWEADYELRDDWSDLIEYVIHKFMDTQQKNPFTLSSTSLTALTKEHNMETAIYTWTQEEMDVLYWYYVQSKKNNDAVGKIIRLLSNKTNQQKSRISIIQQLLQQDIITLLKYDDLMKFEDTEYHRNLLNTPTSGTIESGVEIKDTPQKDIPADDIQILRDLIIKEKKGQLLIWLQKILLECCYIKIILKDNPLRKAHQNLAYVMEPVAYHYILKKKSIPIVQWNNEQATMMLYQPFVLLLHKLGFHLPVDAGSVFARIPDFWTSEMMFNLAKKLGSVEKLLIKFDIHQFDVANNMEMPHLSRSSCDISNTSRNSLSSISSLKVNTKVHDKLLHISEVDDIIERPSKTCEIFAVPNAKHSNSIIRYTPQPTALPTIPNWLQVVMRSKCNGAAANAATASLANLAASACHELDTASNDETASTTILRGNYVNTTNSATNVSSSNLAEENVTINNTTQTSTKTMATRSILHATTAATTMVPCPSINQIIAQQHKSNNNDCEKLPITKQKLLLSTSFNTLTKTSLTENATSALAIPLPTTATCGTVSASPLVASFKEFDQHLQHNISKNDINNQLQQKFLHDRQLLYQQLQYQHQKQQEQHKHVIFVNNNEEDYESIIKSVERYDSSASSGFYTHSGNFEQENFNDNIPVESDLTHMYVSDEEPELISLYE